MVARALDLSVTRRSIDSCQRAEYRPLRSAFTLIELLVVITVIAVLIALLVPAVQSVRQIASRAQCSNQMRQIALASLQYETTYRGFPYGRITGSGSNFGWGELARVLPHLEQQSLYDKITFTQLPGHASNKTARQTQVAVFLCPADFHRLPGNSAYAQPGWGRNSYRGNAGSQPGTMSGGKEQNDGVFMTNTFVTSAAVRDGLSNTALYSERVIGDGSDEKVSPLSDWFLVGNDPKTSDEVHRACDSLILRDLRGPEKQISKSGRNWTFGNYIPTRYNHVTPPNGRSCSRGGGSGALDPTVNEVGGSTSATSLHPGGVNLALGDGSVRFSATGIDVLVWRAAGSRNGGEVASFGD